MAVEVRLIPCLSDNYAVLVHEPESKTTALVDAPEAAPILSVLDKEGWTLTHILITHHHPDHVQGIKEIRAKYPVPVYGPRAEADKIPGISIKLGHLDVAEVGPLRAEIIDTPGHTAGHIVYHFPKEQLLFAGDTLFTLGCGRNFERPAEVLWQSLLKLRELPPETKVYSGHEYTLGNAKFSVTVDPNNTQLKARLKQIEEMRAKNMPTVPSTMEEEIHTNPFMRADNPDVQQAIGMQGGDPGAVFTKLREMKNTFKG
jgi:hydroxyacylglutathione hydrolase